MRTPYAEVLASENASLSGITDRAMLAGWRHRIVEELMTPRSPYVLALQQTDDACERADFLDQWRELIAKTVARLLRCGSTVDAPWHPARAPSADVDAQRTAVLILAALHGGSTLSQLSRDRRPLNAALDLALAPFAATEDN
jgi:hypothetical protein